MRTCIVSNWPKPPWIVQFVQLMATLPSDVGPVETEYMLLKTPTLLTKESETAMAMEAMLLSVTTLMRAPKLPTTAPADDVEQAWHAKEMEPDAIALTPAAVLPVTLPRLAKLPKDARAAHEEQVAEIVA